MRDYPTSNLVNLESIRVDSPLAKLYMTHLKTPSIKRLATYDKYIRPFHFKLGVTSAVDGRIIELNKKVLISFGSGNYLGFDQHPKLIEAAIRAIKEFGLHHGSSRMFTSHSNLVRLEEDISSLVGSEKSLVCANVSTVHIGAIQALFGNSNSTIFIDRYAHATMYQASLIAQAKGARIVKCDVDHENELVDLLRRNESPTRVLMIDGIYSMKGILAEVPKIQSICDRHRCVLYIDDAHGTGVIGENGGGVASHYGLSYDNMLIVGSLQKGLAAFGGFISGKSWIIDLIKVNSSGFIFTGPPQPQAVEEARAAIALCRSDEGRQARSRLRETSKYIRKQLQTIGFQVPDGESPIIPIPIGSDLRTLMAGRKMFDEGVYINSVVFPAVPKNEGIIRISLNANHTDEQIEYLLKAARSLKAFLDDNRGWVGNLRYAKEIVVARIKGENYAGL